ncbi:TPA: hypothetical protein OL624_001170 [Escherichia coli]|nr:hypothetical protein [Escherichia coli]EKQ8355758.1 hypothetical protein [Escherichia coli]EKV7563824.1 hypothetical protein [Escherichia coli]MBE0709406.1 hypothetical protein [Escherichia coli]MBE0903658.1 hypothetical protein [Escherichia coli]
MATQDAPSVFFIVVISAHLHSVAYGAPYLWWRWWGSRKAGRFPCAPVFLPPPASSPLMSVGTQAVTP